MRNILDLPTFKIVDRRAILERVLDALLNDPACRWKFTANREVTQDEESNWAARQTICDLLFSFRIAEPVKPAHKEPIDDAA